MPNNDERTSNPPRAPDIAALTTIMSRLRAPDGCPWDREQTHQTLKPYLIEEAYEVAEAIDTLALNRPSEHIEGADYHALCEELGDLQLQIVFHAQLANERGAFDMQAVIEGICDKMIRRHPHVFGNEKVESVGAVVDRWAQLKRQEGRQIFAGLPKRLPQLLRAQRVGERAAGLGFDWSDVTGVLAKVKEELAELEVEIERSDPSRIAAELGDLLFAITSLARHLDVVAEDALAAASATFQTRFIRTEKLARADGRSLRDCDESELDAFWEAAKAELRRLDTFGRDEEA